MRLLATLRARLGNRDGGVSYEDARRRVACGAQYLDDRDPGWYERIDPGTLALEDGTCCVLGQLYGEFRRGLSAASLINLSSAPRTNLSPVAHGFQGRTNVPDALQEVDYRYLNRAWQDEIALRRPHRPAPPPHRPARKGLMTLDPGTPSPHDGHQAPTTPSPHDGHQAPTTLRHTEPRTLTAPGGGVSYDPRAER